MAQLSCENNDFHQHHIERSYMKIMHLKTCGWLQQEEAMRQGANYFSFMYPETDWDKLTSNASYCDALRGTKCHFYDINYPKKQSLNLSMKKHKPKL